MGAKISRVSRAMRRRLSGRKGAEVRMLWVRSASDQDDPDVLGHGHHHLAEVLDLGFLAIAELQLVELGDTGDQLGDGVAKLLGKIVLGDRGIFDDVVQHGSHQGLVIEAHVAQDAGHGNGMGCRVHHWNASVPGEHHGLPHSLPGLLNLLGWQVGTGYFFKIFK